MKPVYVKWGLGLILTSITALVLDALFLEKYYFKVKNYFIGKKGSQKHLKLLLITDLHFVKYLRPYHKRLARSINTINPDVLLIAGDLIDYSGELTPAKQFLSLLNKNIPKLAIAGNHDHKNDVSIGALKKLLSQNKGHLLINETKQIIINGELLTITGIEDFIEGKPNLPRALQSVGKAQSHILLVHSPLQQEMVQQELFKINLNRSKTDQIDLQYIFAGHNHGGQVRFGKFAPVLPEQSGNYLDGWYNTSKPYLYVSKGFGTSGVPFRFGARSEIILFHYGV